MSDNEWRVVRRKKRGVRKDRNSSRALRRKVIVLGEDMVDAEEIPTKENVSKAREKLEEVLKILEKNTYWEEISTRIRDGINGRDVVAFHCLGIGSFANCLASRYQFACALLLKACFAGRAKCTLADPAMEGVDRMIANEHSFEIIETTSIEQPRGANSCPNIVEVSRPSDSECVLWFMPHCPLELYEYVLERCSRFGYYGMVFFGNKLSDYGQGNCSRCDLRQCCDELCPSLNSLCKGKLLKERDCPDSSPYESAFNDMSVITVKSEEMRNGVVE